MARANLGQLLGNVGENLSPTVLQTVAVKLTGAAVEAQHVATRPSRSARPAPAVSREHKASAALPVQGDGATYLRYVRKETRLREDQQNRLTLEARRLNRAKTTQGVRITENSLIRIAVDLLLAGVGEAAGDDEDAIRKSMTS